MKPLRSIYRIGIPTLSAESTQFGRHPIRQFSSTFTTLTNRSAQIAPGACRSSGPRPLFARSSHFPRRGVETKHEFDYSKGTPKRSDTNGTLGILFAATVVAALAQPATTWINDRFDVIKSVDDNVQIDNDAEEENTTKYRLQEVTEHDENCDSKWIVRGTQVYDITDFIECHPGGKVILRACGGSIDPFWKFFTIHDKPEVRKVLDDYWIGEIDERDLDTDGNINWTVLGPDAAKGIDDPFKDDPERDANLIVQTAKPCNAETPGKLLADFITPIRLFFVRNHLWVPRIEAKDHKLEIELSDGEESTYTIDELKSRFKSHTITVTLQCAGNRRGHMNHTDNGKTSGLAWDVGAIGTAEFTGVRLRDILLDSGYDVQNACQACPNNPDNDRHIHFTAPSDTYEQSIPLHAALSETSDVLLAWEMNGEPMPRDHGGPLRAIVPGSIATRSVKWVGKVRISCDESQSNWHNRDYKCFGPNVRAKDLKPEDWEKAQSIQELPVQSAITNICRSKDRSKTSTAVQGFAYAGGGRKIVRVDVSADGGKTWKQAQLRDDEAKGAKRWAWTLWDCEWNKDQVREDAEFVVKAVDESYNCQPPTFDGIWNFRGLLGNAWHRVPLSSTAAVEA